jgi:hypothetical protein
VKYDMNEMIKISNSTEYTILGWVKVFLFDAEVL